MHKAPWLLPDGIDEVLPPDAALLEQLRRELLDLYQCWGYELVIPPFVEFLDSLLTGTGGDLELQTFKLTDQLTGRTLGIRADITPQAARIDAHQLRRTTPTRLCYLGTVLHTRPDGFAGSRSPLQIGLELYGHSGVASDIEVLQLMLLTLKQAGIHDLYLDLGHVGIFRGLAQQAKLTTEQEAELFDALQRKALPEIDQLLEQFAVASPVREMLQALAELNGSDALKRATSTLAAASTEVKAALAYLQQIANLLVQWLPDTPVHFDLAELRGYHFHTGVVFAAFIPESGQEIARGGRYDHIGATFGQARPATGFSTDLKTLLQLSQKPLTPKPQDRIFAPWTEDQQLRQQIAELRTQGRCVICALPGQEGSAKEMECQWQFVQQAAGWQLVAVQ